MGGAVFWKKSMAIINCKYLKLLWLPICSPVWVVHETCWNKIIRWLAILLKLQATSHETFRHFKCWCTTFGTHHPTHPYPYPYPRTHPPRHEVFIINSSVIVPLVICFDCTSWLKLSKLHVLMVMVVLFMSKTCDAAKRRNDVSVFTASLKICIW